MEIILTIFLAGLALIYILTPLFGANSAAVKAKREATWHSAEQLEIDRELGKIDQKEYEELKANLPALVPLGSLEGLILKARRDKRLEASVEAEISKARERAQSRDLKSRDLN